MLCSSHPYYLLMLSHWEHGSTNRFIQMKTLRFIGMAIIAVIMSVNFMACSDDDEDTPPTSENIAGQWTLVYEEVWEKFVNHPEENYEWAGKPMEECYFFGHLTLRAEGTFTEYEMDNSTLGTGEWELKNQAITLIYDGDEEYPITLKVLELTSNKLVLEYYDKQDDGDEEYCKMTYQRK